MSVNNIVISLILTVGLGASSAIAAPGNQEPTEGKPPVENFLDCTSFTWMHNCNETNRWVAQNPDKPLRINKDGIEWYFPPGTPSVTIDWVVNQTPQALDRYIQYLERTHTHHTRAARMYQVALEARGGNLKGFDSIQTIRDSKPYASLPKINQGNVSMYVFYNSQCSACKLLEPHIADLHKKYPQIEISMLQINNDPSYVEYVRRTVGVPAAQLSATQFAQYRSRVNVTPTIWVEDKRTKQTSVIEGYVPLPEIARHLARLSK